MQSDNAPLALVSIFCGLWYHLEVSVRKSQQQGYKQPHRSAEVPGDHAAGVPLNSTLACLPTLFNPKRKQTFGSQESGRLVIQMLQCCGLTPVFSDSKVKATDHSRNICSCFCGWGKVRGGAGRGGWRGGNEHSPFPSLVPVRLIIENRCKCCGSRSSLTGNLVSACRILRD